MANEIGGTSRWDSARGEAETLLGWKEIDKLRKEGVRFGSHTLTHTRLTTLAPAEIVREGVGARTLLEERLGEAVEAIAYPFGDVDGSVRELMGASGYTYGLTCRPDHCRADDPLLDLPRVYVRGGLSLEEFGRLLRRPATE